ncbi:Topless-related protein 1 [Camellia lanceoleosa]|uniref:Topless-related protein 1 n=1 Tax=Camellia lanceoleosa TaxID=1840588 RepID=A0ACC0FL35_9ERIC|nr:Topless-related protein 1 [Camellia lanceoleosa]
MIDGNRPKEVIFKDIDSLLSQVPKEKEKTTKLVLLETLEKLVINPISTASSSSATEGGVSGMGSPGKNGDAGNSKDIKPELPAESNEILEVWKSEINEPSQCQSLRLPSEVKIEKISRLIYTNAGNSIVALASNGIHLLWKWSRNETN